MKRRNFQEGMTLLEVLIVVAILGILAAIAIVNYAGAVTKAKQKRTMAGIRNVATAWEARAAETQSYAIAGMTFPTALLDAASLRSALVPTYAREIVVVDGWGRPLEFAAMSGSADGEGGYFIRSAGRDAQYDASYNGSPVTRDPDCDIVFSDGQFVQYPDVVQSN